MKNGQQPPPDGGWRARPGDRQKRLEPSPLDFYRTIPYNEGKGVLSGMEELYVCGN